MAPKASPAKTSSPSVISTPYTPINVGSIIAGAGVNNQTPSSSTAANLETQAAITAALKPYIKQMSEFNQSVNNNGQTLMSHSQMPSLTGGYGPQGVSVPYSAGVSPLNQSFNHDYSLISDPKIRAIAEQGQEAIAKDISGGVNALEQTNKNMGPVNTIDTLLQAIQSRIDYYGNANAIPAIAQDPITHTLANLLASVVSGNTSIPSTDPTSTPATPKSPASQITPAQKSAALQDLSQNAQSLWTNPFSSQGVIGNFFGGLNTKAKNTPTVPYPVRGQVTNAS